jgi:prepilin-type N-terminal cleavage/methylation domain-containing protein
VNSRSGLTFIELTVVLLIIGLVMAVAMPSFVNLLRSTKTGVAMRQLVGYMKYIREKAVRENKEFTMVFDRVSNQYWAAIEVPEEEMPPDYYYAPQSEKMRMRYPVYEDEFVDMVELESEVTIMRVIEGGIYELYSAIVRDYYTLVFYPDGTATRATIYAQGPNEEIMTIHIKPFTGEVELFEGYEEVKPLPQLTEEN